MPSLSHLAHHVTDLEGARRFCGELLGCAEGPSTETWVDFGFFGHQISLHVGQPFATSNTGKVGDQMVLMPHLGVILDLESWGKLAGRLVASGLEFVIPRTLRFEGDPGEQRTMFFRDPSGSPIKVKGFASTSGVFAS
ncbi:VOC family protein [Actibacterium pelagium]|uniref:Dioxygenase n=1 Tax=Actibacterium pelagium TaxID=2029103 RepID=A0A917EIU3_9RHOB|nr:dioxygenase [Actibacterium pelagium]GGE48200.1 dioxygenase [Actibacterium pelagium]